MKRLIVIEIDSGAETCQESANEPCRFNDEGFCDQFKRHLAEGIMRCQACRAAEAHAIDMSIAAARKTAETRS